MSKEHLCPPWKKGQSGNPKGRPVGTGRKTFQKIFESLPKGAGKIQHPDYGELDAYQSAMIQLVEAAANGEPWAIRDLLDRGLGKAMQTMEIDHDGQMVIKWKPLSTTGRTKGSKKSTRQKKDSG